MVRLNGNESTRVFCDCIARILFEILEVIVTHQAIEFTSLVEKILDVFLLYLQVDDELIFEKKCLQHPRWKILFENLHSLFQDQKKKIFQALNILMGKKISDDLKKKKESKKLSVVVNDERFLYLEQRNFQMDALDLHRVERAIDFFQEKIQKKNNIGIFHSQPWSIQVEFVLPFLKLLVDPKMSKALLKRLFEILVQIVRTEETSNVTEMILLEYAKVLRFFRKSQVIEHESTPSMTFYTNFTPKTVGTVNLSLKETIVSYANDFLGCCRNGMTRQWILHELFMDQSDFSKLKLLSYFKSSIVKNIPSFGTVIHEKSP
jgi:hypothetical protein